MSGTLHVVATPIGNLEDLSPRARQTLADVDLVAAEDTRHTGRLLSHFGIKTRQFSLHDYNEERVVTTLIEALEGGQSVALVSDAGTPLVSDPGYRLVKAAHEHGIRVSPVPGPSALTAALSAAGLPTDRFCFEGFLPAKSGARKQALANLVGETRTLVFYESVHRARDCIDDMLDAFGEARPAFVGRELSKLNEQCFSGPLSSVAAALDDGAIPAKGEFVIIVAGAERPPASAVDVERLLVELRAVLPVRQAAAIAARVTGERRNDLYQRLLELDASSPD